MNAAKDSTELVGKLRSCHYLSQTAPKGDPRKAGMRYGLDLLNGEIRDNVTAGVLEPTMSKVKSLKSAYEAAVSLLRIDDAISVAPGATFAPFSSRHPPHPDVTLQKNSQSVTIMAIRGGSIVEQPCNSSRMNRRDVKLNTQVGGRRWYENRFFVIQHSKQMRQDTLMNLEGDSPSTRGDSESH